MGSFLGSQETPLEFSHKFRRKEAETWSRTFRRQTISTHSTPQPNHLHTQGFQQMLYWGTGGSPRAPPPPSRGRGHSSQLVFTALPFVQALVFLLVRGLGKAHGGRAVTVTDEILTRIVFAWKRAEGRGLRRGLAQEGDRPGHGRGRTTSSGKDSGLMDPVKPSYMIEVALGKVTTTV